MTKLLTQVVRKIEELPEERQEDAAAVLMTILENDAVGHQLSDEQLQEVELAKREVRDGKIATQAMMRALWRNFGA